MIDPAKIAAAVIMLGHAKRKAPGEMSRFHIAYAQDVAMLLDEVKRLAPLEAENMRLREVVAEAKKLIPRTGYIEQLKPWARPLAEAIAALDRLDEGRTP